MSPIAERLLVAAARTCAVVVVAIPPLVIVALITATVTAFFMGAASMDLMQFVKLVADTLAVGLAAATVGSAIGIGGAVFTVEIASAPVRQTVKALVGALHAVPAVGFGAAVAGVLLYSRAELREPALLLVAALVVSIMIASVVFVQMRRELSNLPRGVREAATALGADKVQTALRGFLPGLHRTMAGIWWSALALALGEATALSMIFAAAGAKAGASTNAAMQGTLASTLLYAGAGDHGTSVIGLAPAALCLFALVYATVWFGRRATGNVPWP